VVVAIVVRERQLRRMSPHRVEEGALSPLYGKAPNRDYFGGIFLSFHPLRVWLPPMVLSSLINICFVRSIRLIKEQVWVLGRVVSHI
jgi:hypothetical protein